MIRIRGPLGDLAPLGRGLAGCFPAMGVAACDPFRVPPVGCTGRMPWVHLVAALSPRYGSASWHGVGQHYVGELIDRAEGNFRALYVRGWLGGNGHHQADDGP